jgi:hypothetical protein
MAVETGNYIDDLVITNPPSSDLVSEGDNQLRLIKTFVKQSFPSVDAPVHAIHPTSTEPATSLTAGLMWFDTAANLLKIRNEANDAWVELAVSIITSNSVDVNAGTVDGAVIGGATPAAITGTTLTGNTSLALATGATVTGVDNGALGTSATLLATQGAIKTYVDAQLTAEDLDFQGDSGTGAVDLDSQTLDIAGGSGITTTAGSQTLTIAGDDATTSTKGVASFSSDNFGVSSGAVTIKDGGVVNAELGDMAANTVKVRNANSSGVPSDLALATTEVMIGDGTGFTAAALSGDVSMTNAGVVTVDSIQGEAVSATSAANDQYLKYSALSSEWQKVDVLSPDRLSTKGDLLVYNSVDSETAYKITDSSYPGTDGYALTALASATNGVAWNKIGPSGLANTAVTANTYAYPSEIIVDAQGRLTSATAGTAGATAGFSVAMAIAL